MTVSFRSPVSSPNTNNAYLSRITDSQAINVISLNNALPESGNQIVNLQRAINKLLLATGVISETNAESNEYANENFIENGDTYKTAIEKIDAALKDAEDARLAIISIINEGAFKFKPYATDNDYINAEIEDGLAENLVGGEVYYNTTIGSVRFWDHINEEWISLDFKFTVKREVPTGDVDGTNNTFIISELPISADALNVYINGILQHPNRYSYFQNEGEIIFNTSPSLGQEILVSYLTQGVPSQPINNNIMEVEYITLDAGMISNKFTSTTYLPTPFKIMLDVSRKVTAAIPGVDFEIFIDEFFPDWATIGWDGFDLEADLVEGDVLRVMYMRRE
jgi:hypothetical protein